MYTFSAFAKLLIIRQLAGGEIVALRLSEAFFCLFWQLVAVGIRVDLSKFFRIVNFAGYSGKPLESIEKESYSLPAT